MAVCSVNVPSPAMLFSSDAIRPYAMAGGYSNFQMDEPDRVQGMYGPNYDRLARIKAKYDPDNIFRVNQNIKPAS